MNREFRKEWILSKGDTISCGKYTYTIIDEPIGYGGTSVLYPAKRSDSEMEYAIKECFPNFPGRFCRRDGVVDVVSLDDKAGKAFLQNHREIFEQERRISQKIRNNSSRIFGIWDAIEAKSIIVGGHEFEASEGIFSLLERIDLKGCTLEQILDECRKEEEHGYPLRTGGLPKVYVTACIMEQILRALRNVHEAGFLFGDIQPKNIFFMDHRFQEGDIGTGSLLDFGCARALMDDGYTEEIINRQIFSTEGYTPPEIIKDNDGSLRLGKQVDTYAAGRLMLLCLLTNCQDLTATCISRKRILLSYHGKKIGCSERALIAINAILEKALQSEVKNRYSDASEMLKDIVHLKQMVMPPKFLLSKNISIPDYFVPGSREEEIRNLRKSLECGEIPMLWGIGGIGKTETAIEFARRIDTGQGIYLVHFERSMRETILKMGFSGYRYIPQKGGNFQINQEQQEYEERITILQEYYAESILIIDNFDCEGKTLDDLRSEQAYKDLIGLGIRLIFTTRYPVDREEWEIKKLKNEELIKLVRYYYRDETIEDVEILELIELVEGHTVTIYLIAKTLEASMGEIALKEIIKVLRDNALAQEDFPKVSSDQNRQYKHEKVYSHLKTLFNMAEMNQSELRILVCAVLLPVGGMHLDTFASCLESVDKPYLRELVKRGWLRKNKENILSIHPVIRTVCMQEIKSKRFVSVQFLNKLWKFYDEKKYDEIRYKEMADCFAWASEIQNAYGDEYATYAAQLYRSIGSIKSSLEYYIKALYIIESKFSVKSRWYAEALTNVGITYSEIGEVEIALEYNKRAMEMSEEILPPEDPVLVKSYVHLGIDYLSLGKVQEAIALYRKAVHIAERNPFIYEEELSIIYNGMGIAYGKCGDCTEEFNCFLKALKILEENPVKNDRLLARLYINLGICYGRKGDFTKQLEFAIKGMKLSEEILGRKHIEVAQSYQAVSSAYNDLRDNKNALKYIIKALEIQEDNLPADSLRLANSYFDIGVVYGQLGDDTNSLVYSERAMEIRERKLPKDHICLAKSYSNIGLANLKLGNLNETLKYYYKAVEIQEKNVSLCQEELANSYFYIGIVYGKENNHVQAIEFLQKSINLQEKNNLVNNKELMVAYDVLARTYYEIRNWQKLIECMVKKTRIFGQSIGYERKTLADDYNFLGIAFGKVGSLDKQLECFLKAKDVLEGLTSNNKSELARCYRNVALAYGELGNFVNRLEFYEKMVQIYEEIQADVEQELEERAMAYNDAGVAYGDVGNYEKQLELCLSAIRLVEERGLNQHLLVRLNINISFAYGMLDNYEEQLRYSMRVLDIQENVLREDEICLIDTFEQIGHIYGNLKEFGKQLEHYKRAVDIREKKLTQDVEGLLGSYSNIIFTYIKLRDFKKCGEYVVKYLKKIKELRQE